MIQLSRQEKLDEESNQNLSVGVDFNITDNFVLSIATERGNSSTLRFSYKNDPKVNPLSI